MMSLFSDPFDMFGLFEEESSLSWVAFGWHTDAVLNGFQTMMLIGSLNGYRSGTRFYAKKERGGPNLALMRVTQSPYIVRTDTLTAGDQAALGLDYLATKEKEGVKLERQRMKTQAENLWVVRFTIEQYYDQSAPKKGTVTVGGID